MKYYAVTEDPNELMHYGRLGMKWGQHIFAGEKSLAYKKASQKLSRSMKSGIAKVKANWKKAHSPAALRKKAAVKEKKFMEKSIQKAREGRLKYGKLTDDQVRKVTERLQLEQKARQLGSTEKSKFRVRMKDAIQEGMLQGAIKGGSAYIEERWKAKGKVDAKKKYGRKLAEMEAKEAGIKQARTKIESKKATEAYERQEQRKQQHRETAKKAAKGVATAPVKLGKTLYKVTKKGINASRSARQRKYQSSTFRPKKKRRPAYAYRQAPRTPYAYSLSDGEYRIE